MRPKLKKNQIFKLVTLNATRHDRVKGKKVLTFPELRHRVILITRFHNRVLLRNVFFFFM